MVRPWEKPSVMLAVVEVSLGLGTHHHFVVLKMLILVI